MPHIIVKMYKGRTQEQKEKLALELKKTVMETINASETYVSVSIEDYEPSAWAKVYKEEITDKPETLFIKPKYKP